MAVDKCDWCEYKYEPWDVITVHTNICQTPKIRTFCSKNCKLNWIYKIQEDRDNE